MTGKKEINPFLKQALELGPWELDVHLQVTHAVMATWDALRSDAQSAFLGHFEELAQSKADWVPRTLAIASQYERQRILCDRLGRLNLHSADAYRDKVCLAD